MGLLIDTSALIAVRNADDKNHKKAVKLMIDILRGKFGKIFVSDYIFDEAVTLAYIRTRRKEFARDIGTFARARPINLRFIEPVDFEKAWELYFKYEDKPLNFTDCTNLALMDRVGIETIFSFDKEFKGLVDMAS